MDAKTAEEIIVKGSMYHAIIAPGYDAQLDELVVDKDYTVVAHYPESGGIFTTAEVTYRGVRVGTVGDMTLTQDGSNNQAMLTQIGSDNAMNPTQIGNNNQLAWSQIGNNLSDLGVHQTGGQAITIVQTQ